MRGIIRFRGESACAHSERDSSRSSTNRTGQWRRGSQPAWYASDSVIDIARASTDSICKGRWSRRAALIACRHDIGRRRDDEGLCSDDTRSESKRS
jgi:hypothetical protein